MSCSGRHKSYRTRKEGANDKGLGHFELKPEKRANVVETGGEVKSGRPEMHLM